MSFELTPEDDSLHLPTVDDIWWAETHWFSFDQPGANRILVQVMYSLHQHLFSEQQSHIRMMIPE